MNGEESQLSNCFICFVKVDFRLYKKYWKLHKLADFSEDITRQTAGFSYIPSFNMGLFYVEQPK